MNFLNEILERTTTDSTLNGTFFAIADKSSVAWAREFLFDSLFKTIRKGKSWGTWLPCQFT